MLATVLSIVSLCVSFLAFIVNSISLRQPVFIRQVELRTDLRELLYQMQDAITDPSDEPADVLSTAPTKLNRIARTLESPGEAYINDVVRSVMELRASWTSNDPQNLAKQREFALTQIEDCIVAISDIEKDRWSLAQRRYKTKRQ
jgi:hypothetical protein